MPRFLTESVAEIFGNMMGTPHAQNVRRRGFMKFYKIFAKLWHLKVESKMAFFHVFIMIFHPKSMLDGENKFVTPRGGLVRLFGLPWGFTPNQLGSRQKEISDQAHPLPCQTEKSKMQTLAKNTENRI